MKHLLILLLLAIAPLAAQEKEAEANGMVKKIVPVRYVDPLAVQRLLLNFGVEVRADSQLKVVALSGRKSAIEAAEEAIKQLDVPAAAQKDVELTVYFVVGSDGRGPSTAPPVESPVPPELEGTMATLKTTFPFKSYSLLDALSLRSRAGTGGGTTGQLSGARLTQFSVRSVNVEAGGMIRIDQMHAGLRVPRQAGPNKIEYLDTGITTDVVDIKEGQKLVVGRSSLDGPARALFLVLIAKVAQ